MRVLKTKRPIMSVLSAFVLKAQPREKQARQERTAFATQDTDTQL
jgi:hypothetical protein